MLAEDPVVSVIVPIYNVERYLAQCVESVLTQTFRQIEVILVDDGSPDGSGAIADDFAERDPRVIVIHQANQGLSGARNSGLRRARGTYVVYLDSDDFWDGADSLRQCVEALDENPGVDVLFFDALRYHEDSDERIFGDVEWHRSRVVGASGSELLRYMVDVGDVRPSACTKLIRRQFLVDKELCFTPGIFSEDVEWFLRLIVCEATYDYLPLRLYMYRKNRAGSITNTIGRRNVEDVLNTVLAASRRIRQDHFTPSFTEDYLSYCCYQFTIALAFYAGLSRSDRRALRALVDEASSLLAHDGYGRSREVARLARVIGVQNTGRVLNGFIRSRAILSTIARAAERAVSCVRVHRGARGRLP